MTNTNRNIRITFRILMVAALAIINASCLVDTKDVPDVTIEKTTNDLRLIQNGDLIDYNFGGTMTTNSGTQMFNGRIEVEWHTANVAEPLGSGQSVANMFKETTLVIQVQSDGSETIFRQFSRYISQDPDTGTIYLEAFNDSTDTYFWSSDNFTSFNYVPAQLMASPLVASADPPYTMYFFQGCDGVSQCTSNQYITVTDTYSIQDNSVAKTLLGNFETFRINYSSWTALLSSNPVSNPPQFMDLRKLCAEATQSAGTISGNMDVHPQLGMVRMESICNSGTDLSYSFTAEISNTNIDY